MTHRELEARYGHNTPILGRSHGSLGLFVVLYTDYGVHWSSSSCSAESAEIDASMSWNDVSVFAGAHVYFDVIDWFEEESMLFGITRTAYDQFVIPAKCSCYQGLMVIEYCDEHKPK